MARLAIIGIALCAFGTFITCVNLYLSFVRYPLHRLRGGTRENYRWVSGIPAVGTVCLWLGARLLSSHPTLMWIAIAISFLDPAGFPAFCAVMAYQLIRQNKDRRL